MKRILLLIIAIAASQIAFGQSFEVPKKYAFENEKDYEIYKPDIINCINWLQQTSLDEDPDKRKEASLFFLKWLTGAPDVTIEINSNVTAFSKKNPDLLTLFMAGWAKFEMENPSCRGNKTKGNLSGLNCAIKFYKNGNGTKKDEKMDELALMDSKQLGKWVEEQLKK